MPQHAGTVLPSTTSHKGEALLPTLAVFARLGFTAIDLNLNHIVEGGLDPSAVEDALATHGIAVPLVSGGWCDFFDSGSGCAATRASVDRQAALARRFRVNRLRLFFGRLAIDQCTPEAIERCSRNIRDVADAHPDIVIGLENHDGASSRPSVCRAVLESVGRANVHLTFDPINFEHRNVRTLDALAVLQPFVGHVHLKGYRSGEFCGFGEGDVDLAPALRMLAGAGYAGAFTVEYEGPGDRTVRLYQSVERARTMVTRLFETV